MVMECLRFSTLLKRTKVDIITYRNLNILAMRMPSLWSSGHLYHLSPCKPSSTQHCRYQHSEPANPKKSPPWRVLFFGTDEFALPHLRMLNENQSLSEESRVVDYLEVVVPKTKRGCLVKEYAKIYKLRYHKWPVPTMENQFDLGVITSFGHLIPERVINMFPLGILNVHPSLLPRWRGAAPIAHTILNGDVKTGITIMEIKPRRFDVGDILLQKEYQVPSQCTTPKLIEILANEGAELLLNTLKDLNSLREQKSVQTQEEASYAPKLPISEAYVDWTSQCMDDIDRRYRAVGAMFSLRTELLEKQVRLSEMQTAAQMEGSDVWKDDSSIPGSPFYDKKLEVLCIRCKDGWVGFKKIVFNKPMTAKAFYNGYLSDDRNPGAVFTSQRIISDKQQAKSASGT